MLEGLANVGWNDEVSPSWSSADEVCKAIHSLALATAESGDAAYSRMLYAVGNDHAGTYFPVILAVIPFLGEILGERECASAARARTLDVLIDLVGSFEPEVGFELVDTSGGVRPLKDVLKERTLELEGTVEGLLAANASQEEARLARDLLEFLRE